MFNLEVRFKLYCKYYNYIYPINIVKAICYTVWNILQILNSYNYCRNPDSAYLKI